MVDIKHQQPLDGREKNFPTSPTFAYRHEDYNPDLGAALTRRRVGMGGVDMRRSSGRRDTGGRGGKGQDTNSHQRAYCSDGATLQGNMINEGERKVQEL